MEDDFAFPQKQFQNNFLVDKYTCFAPYVPATFWKAKEISFFVSASETIRKYKLYFSEKVSRI